MAADVSTPAPPLPSAAHAAAPPAAPRSGPWRRVMGWVSVLSLVALLVRYLVHNPEWFYVEFVFLVELLALTAFTRTVSSWQVAGYFARGIWLSMPLTLVVGQWFVGRVLGVGPDRLWMKGLAVPVLEESMKILPVLLAAGALARRRLSFNPSDWLVLGAACGAGFDIVEKLFYANNFQFTYGPHVGRFFFFPDALGVSLGRDGWSGFIGHAAASGFIGLGMGAGLHWRKTATRPMALWWWTVPVAAFTWVVYEHALWNLRLASGWALRLTPAALTPWLFAVAACLIVGVDAASFRRCVAASPGLRSARSWVWAVLTGAAATVPAGVPFWRAWNGCWRWLRLANTVAWCAPSAVPAMAAVQPHEKGAAS
jgi:RsiW-degrading membrane proteinase PrsW (M82 family)